MLTALVLIRRRCCGSRVTVDTEQILGLIHSGKGKGTVGVGTRKRRRSLTFSWPLICRTRKLAPWRVGCAGYILALSLWQFCLEY